MIQVNHAGISVVVLTYHRRKGLRQLLESLLKQRLAGLKLELIICNNAADDLYHASRFTRLGRLFRQFADCKIINSSHNWRTDIRYPLALLGKYETILFLDDDMVLRDADFIAYYYSVFKSLGQYDILSCWNELWTSWDAAHLEYVAFNFKRRGLNDLMRSDVCGPGVCMFNKAILQSQKMMDGVIPSEFPRADDMAFGPVAWMVWGSTVYYLPSYGKIDFDMKLALHDEALFFVPDHNKQLYAYYKKLIADGYQPVLQRLAESASQSWLPETAYARSLKSKYIEW